MFHTKQDVDRHVNEVFKNIKSEYQRNLKCYQIAKLYFKFRDYKSAVKYINRYILSTSNSAAAHRLLGECYLALNLKSKAFNAFKTSLECNGIQHDLVLKICTILLDPEVFSVTPGATYWLHRAESLFPSSPIIFQLKEQILKSGLEGKQDNGQMENLILSEIKARPTDVTVRIRLLNFFLETKRFKIAYQHALEIEERNTFSSDLRWYDCLCNIVQAYEKANNDLCFSFHIKKLYFLERRADLFLQEFRDHVKTISECSQALFVFDQSLQSVSDIAVSNEDSSFFKEVLKHMNSQLSFHLATLALKRAKKEYGIWPKAIRAATPLLLLATQNSMDLEDDWYSAWVGKNKMDSEVKSWNRNAALRITQAGHILLAWSENKGSKFLEKVSQYCSGNWRNQVYQEIFYNKQHLQAMNTSHFINDGFFSSVPLVLQTEKELKSFDDVAQSTYPDSLHHLVWLGLVNCDGNGRLNPNFRCTIVPDLQFTVSNLSQTGPETLNQLDVDAFLYASVLCGKSATTSLINTDRPNRLPISISEELCTPAQAEWWVAVYKTYTNLSSDNIAEMRLKLRGGIETIRGIGQHGLDVKVIVMLAKLFQERAAASTHPVKTAGLEERAHLHWSSAIPLLERVEKNQKLRIVPNRLFDFKGNDLTPSEIKGYLEDGKLFLACRLMKLGQHEEAIDAFQSLKSPYATFYQGLIYEKLASEEVNHRPESITSENRSQHIILLTRARDAFYLTLDRLRCPSVDANHPLNSQLQDHLEQIEKQLAIIDPDNSINKNGDTESDETADTVPQPPSPDIDDNVGSNLNIYNTSNFLNVKHQGMTRVLRQNLSDKCATRFEARPSPERLDAQLRHLVQANSNGLHSILEHLKDIKSIIQIELKDLGCVTRDLLAEMRKMNEKMDSTGKREIDVLKPEELFNFGEEDYEELNQLPQQYGSYQNYLMNRSVMGAQGTSTIPYGTSSSVSSMIPPVENSLLPPSFYPGHQIDPVLLYQSLGYYQNLPYNDAQNISDIKGAGAQKVGKQKGISQGNGSYKSSEIVLPTNSVTVGGSITVPKVFATKVEPPNVVITSSDVLPAYTIAGTPTLSVTIPPQHIRCSTPAAPKFNTGQTHPFQINMPPSAQLVKECPTEKLNSLKSATPVSVSPVKNSILAPEKIPPVQPTTPFEGAPLTKLTSESTKQNMDLNSLSFSKISLKSPETKLFESDAVLFILEGSDWKEQGLVSLKIVHNEEQKKLKLITLRDPTKVTTVYIITANTVVEPLKNSDVGWTLSVSNSQNSTSKINSLTNEKEIWAKFCVKFNNKSDSEEFEKALVEGLQLLNMNKTSILQKTSLFKNLTKQCIDCQKPFNGNGDSCLICARKKSSNGKQSLGGFTAFTSPIIPTSESKGLVEEKLPEVSKPGPFANFSFSSLKSSAFKPETTVTTSAISSSVVSTSTRDVLSLKNSEMANLNFASLKADPNSFKKDANFKGFEGQNSLVFGYLNKPKPSSEKSDSQEVSAKKDEEDDFVPTAEFTPVVDLPEKVDVKTGEENDEVLFDERAKLLRFDAKQKEWKERGVGNMKLLLNHESGRVRLIMRRDQVLKVCCNHYLDETMEFSPFSKSEKALIWYAQDYSEGEMKAETFALKLKDKDLMLKFLNILRDTQGKMINSRIGGKTESKEEAEKPSELKPLSEVFKPKKGSWECGTCLTRNEENVSTCVCCESSKPGTAVVKDTNQNKLLSGKGITFPQTTMAFTFGIPQQPPVSFLNTKNNSNTSTAAPETTTGTGFFFGIPKMNNTSATTTAVNTQSSFTFSNAITTTSNSTLLSGTALTSNTTFSFGIPSTNVATSTLSSPAKTPIVSTGTATTVGSGFTFSIPHTVTLSSAPIFQNNAETSFSPGTTAAPNNVRSIFGGSLLKEPDKKEVPTSFGNFGVSKGLENKLETKNPTMFNFGSSIKFQEKGTFDTFISNLKPQKPEIEKVSSSTEKDFKKTVISDDNDDKVEENSGDHLVFNPVVPLPGIVDPHTGEEDEHLKYEQRAKLYRLCGKEWKERGIGDIKILIHKTNNKIRLLMRRETILKVCLNQYVTSDIKFHRKDDRAWNWTAPDFSEGEVKYETFAIRFKTPEIADGFMQALEKTKKTENLSEETKSKTEETTQAMKNFSFGTSGLKGSDSFTFSPKVKTNKSEEDISIVYENKVTPEQREKAAALLLPSNFYSYVDAPDCPGCPGCDKDEIHSTTTSTASTTYVSGSINSKPIFGTASQDSGLITFGNKNPVTGLNSNIADKPLMGGASMFPLSGSHKMSSSLTNWAKNMESEKDDGGDADEESDDMDDEEYDDGEPEYEEGEDDEDDEDDEGEYEEQDDDDDEDDEEDDDEADEDKD